MPSRSFLNKISDVMQVNGVGVIRAHGRSEAGREGGYDFPSIRADDKRVTRNWPVRKSR